MDGCIVQEKNGIADLVACLRRGGEGGRVQVFRCNSQSMGVLVSKANASTAHDKLPTRAQFLDRLAPAQNQGSIGRFLRD